MRLHEEETLFRQIVIATAAQLDIPEIVFETLMCIKERLMTVDWDIGIVWVRVKIEKDKLVSFCCTIVLQNIKFAHDA
jgi:hypothetical protein